MGKLEDAERVTVHGAAQWRQWLSTHGADSTGAWVVLPAGTTRGSLYDQLVEEALCFGWIDGVAKPEDGASRLWFAPRSPRSAWAASNKARVERLLADGRMTAAGQALIDAAKANGMWTVLEGPEAGIVPDDLAAALDADPRARATWDSFSPSVRKLALTHIAMAKTAPTVARRIEQIAAAAVRGERAV
ncbi:YdeI/OmpD-associated family protein [Microbacterium gorillae]|uniref:YdeI/OmpD-associated family protein n=1 Tax=Microbacterium gorillae TaxID=1231063 RepID=UPI00058AE788|nr:YdeI/OmpD-associated family protein [Microbacterium gorillae]